MSNNGHTDADLLLIGGGFFGYANEIIRALERRGRKVVWFEDRPALDTFTKSMLRLAPATMVAKSEAYFDRIVDQVRKQPIADVLVIKGEAMSCTSIERLRKALPLARFTLYFWDSYRNMPRDSFLKVPAFNKAFTFDPVDAQTDSRLTYRPLFYLQEYANLPTRDLDVDQLFIGTAHSDRYAVLQRLSKALPASIKFEKVLYFPSRIVYAARRLFEPIFWSARHNEFIFKPLTKIDIQALISRARAIVDIERTAQCGLTMRTVEIFGAGKKLVTTNSKIVDADLFNSNNIAIIDRHRPRMSAQFLESPYIPPPPDMLARYSLDGWLDEVLPAGG
jgi:hypothetical protein